jgi:hypothetical protein
LLVKTRKEIVEVINEIKGLAKNEYEVVYPELILLAIPYLPKFTDRKKYLVYGWVYRLLRGI